MISRIILTKENWTEVWISLSTADIIKKKTDLIFSLVAIIKTRQPDRFPGRSSRLANHQVKMDRLAHAERVPTISASGR